MRAMLSNLFNTAQPQLSPAQLRLLKHAERVLQSEGDGIPASPCISVCRMSEDTKLCEGCFRTIDEITEWSRYAHLGKRDVWRLLVQRVQDSVKARS
jgi:predicted Fe-S protein YdhL (DUF1289 family)